MDKPVSKGLQITFLAHALLSLVFGLALLLVPGRSLSLLGWVPEWVQLPDSDLSIPGSTFIDPLITRLLGAALLALAYLSFRCWMKASSDRPGSASGGGVRGGLLRSQRAGYFDCHVHHAAQRGVRHLVDPARLRRIFCHLGCFLAGAAQAGWLAQRGV